MNETSKIPHAETLALHAGWNGDPATDACAVPVYRMTAYNFASAQDGGFVLSVQYQF